VDAIRTTGRKDQVGPQQSSAGFFKGKFASGQMMLEMEIDPDEPVVETRKMAARKSSIMYSTAPSPPPQQQQLQSMSSMSTGGSESGERSREARTDRSFTRRLVPDVTVKMWKAICEEENHPMDEKPQSESFSTAWGGKSV